MTCSGGLFLHRITCLRQVCSQNLRSLQQVLSLSSSETRECFAAREAVQLADRQSAPWRLALMGPFHAALGLAGIGAQNLDVELRQSPTELRHAISAGGIFSRYPKDRMLVGIERNRLAMVLQIALQSLEIGKRALGWDKAKLHQSAGGVIDEHQKRAGRRTVLEPAMVRTVDLN